MANWMDYTGKVYSESDYSNMSPEEKRSRNFRATTDAPNATVQAQAHAAPPQAMIKVLNKQVGRTIEVPEADIQKYLDNPVYQVMSAEGRPIQPSITSLLDKEGMLQEKYRMQAQPDISMVSNLDELNKRLSGIELNKQGLEAIRKRATTEGPSEWQRLMLQKQGLEESGARDKAVSEQAGVKSGQFSELARKGGLSSGARERMAESGGRDLAVARQGVSRQGQLDRLGIATTDEQQRLDLLKGLPGMELQALEPEFKKTQAWGTLADAEAGRKMNLDQANRLYKTDIEKTNRLATLAEVGRQDSSKMGVYDSAMKEWAAQKQSENISGAEKKGFMGKK